MIKAGHGFVFDNSNKYFREKYFELIIERVAACCSECCSVEYCMILCDTRPGNTAVTVLVPGLSQGSKRCYSVASILPPALPSCVLPNLGLMLPGKFWWKFHYRGREAAGSLKAKAESIKELSCWGPDLCVYRGRWPAVEAGLGLVLCH